MQTVRVLLNGDTSIFYEDVKGNTVHRTLAIRLVNGGAFYGDIGNGRRIMIEEGQR